MAACRGRREQILRPQLLDAEPPGHQPQGPLTQMARLPGLLHQGIQGRPLDVALMAGEIQGIQGPHLATLARELQAPAVEGIEDGGDRLLLPFPAGADGVEGLFAQGPIRAGEQVARLRQPPLLAGDLHPDLAHQIVVEVAPGVQPVGAKADDQLLRLHRQPLILQAALVAQPVLLLPEQGVLHQLLELGLGQPQHQIFDGSQGLEQVRIEGPGAGGQLLGQGIPGVLAPRAGRQHGDVPAYFADAAGPQAYLPQEVLPGRLVTLHPDQSLDKTAQFRQAGAGQAHVRLQHAAVEGGVDVLILPLLWVDSLLHRTLIVRDGSGPS
ncbi:hypothetical protein D3C84_669110 [compost metagenome]